MKALRTLALSLALLAASAAHAGERQMLETYVSPAPSLMSILVSQATELGLNAEQQSKLADWRKAAQPQRERIERDIIADRLAINQAMLDGRSNAEVQAMVKTLQRKEIKLVVAKLACRDNAKKVLAKEQWEKLIAMYTAQP